MTQFTEAVRLSPNQADAHSNLGAVLSRQGRFDEAKAHFGEALRLNPNHADARKNLELVLRKQREGATPPAGGAK